MVRVFNNFTMGVVHVHERRFGRVDTDTEKSLISGGTTPKRVHTYTYTHTDIRARTFNDDGEKYVYYLRRLPPPTIWATDSTANRHGN